MSRCDLQEMIGRIRLVGLRQASCRGSTEALSTLFMRRLIAWWVKHTSPDRNDAPVPQYSCVRSLPKTAAGVVADGPGRYYSSHDRLFHTLLLVISLEAIINILAVVTYVK